MLFERTLDLPSGLGYIGGSYTVFVQSHVFNPPVARKH
ncbi:PTS system, sucrose-specific IIB component [Pseudomonas syringae pv. maculicola]|uniref:PTS system, sucrose-specific IIB component n=1 Tax=Pseudomonas syringae pv. maculicola TaxID=59511 RepID=A0A0N0FZM3_PSEYM|nr:Unknown protein sequence [Pseudomonas syringae pv. maculicola]RMM70663.1 PTS system, sucrose-specific IIB component [Pseudomonas syringae pv. maculicola]RMV39924.1 PTS system, sucrose-specific IIB component [Pseudomonas syringae pv. maculicola]